MPTTSVFDVEEADEGDLCPNGEGEGVRSIAFKLAFLYPTVKFLERYRFVKLYGLAIVVLKQRNALS